jgi:hypothetical protein
MSHPPGSGMIWCHRVRVGRRQSTKTAGRAVDKRPRQCGVGATAIDTDLKMPTARFFQPTSSRPILDRLLRREPACSRPIGSRLRQALLEGQRGARVNSPAARAIGCQKIGAVIAGGRCREFDWRKRANVLGKARRSAEPDVPV